MFAAELGVSRQCAHRWVAPFSARKALRVLVDRSSPTASVPASLRREPVENQVIALRLRERRGQDWIGAELGVPARTVSTILRRREMPYLRHCDPLTGGADPGV